ncbi:MAG: VacJ family lipoprotein [Boseongicola sp.]|nr:MAG: VacJ family lipoprotein [Boseongicola sp.]
MAALVVNRWITPLFVGLLVLSGCSVPNEPTDVHDPYESVNRVTHNFNTAADRVILRPASQVYGHVVPNPVRSSLDNAAGNLGLPASALNKALQGKLEDAVHNVARFMVNTTLGVFGLFDPAQDFGLEARDSNFGETLSVWGAEEGAYQVLPLIGPSTERDTAGLVVDIITNPIGVMFGPDVEDADTGLFVTETLNYRYEFAGTIDSILYDSADSYSQLRIFYLDSRRFAVGTDGEEIAIDPYEDLYDDFLQE